MLAAAQRSMPGCRFRPDCKEVVDTHKRGMDYATGADRVHARTWCMIRAVLGDDATVTCVLAHCSAADVANGKLTARERGLNSEADRLAKKGASMFRLPEALRAEFQAVSDEVQAVGRWLGEITARVSDAKVRDTTAARRQPRCSSWRRRPPLVIPDRPVHLGGHSITRAGRRWCCIECSATSKHRIVLAQGHCHGSSAVRAATAAAQHALHDRQHVPHTIWRTGDFAWCTACGAFSKQRLQLLEAPCRGWRAPGSGTALARLRRGHDPYNGRYLAPPVPPRSGLHAGTPPSASVAPTMAIVIDQAAVSKAVAAGAARWASLLARVRAREAASCNDGV